MNINKNFFEKGAGFQERDIVFLLSRAVVLGSSIMWVSFHPQEAFLEKRLIYYTLAIFVFYSFAFYSLIFEFPEKFKKLSVAALPLDLIVLTILMLHTGGVLSPFFLGYYLMAALYGFYFGLYAAIIIAAGITVLSFAANLSYNLRYFWTVVIYPYGFLWVSAIFSGLFGNMLETEKQQIKNLHATSESQLEKLSTIHEISKSVSTWIELNPLLQEIVNSAARVLKVKACILLFKNPKSGDLEVEAKYVDDVAEFNKYNPTPDMDIEKTAIETGEQILVGDTLFDPRLALWHEKGTEIKNIICVPLRTTKKIYGALEVMDKKDEPFSQSDVDLLNTIATSAATSIANAQLFEEAKNNIDQLQSLISIITAVSYGSSVKDIFRVAIEKISGFFPADGGVIYLVNPKTGALELANEFGYGKDSPVGEHPKILKQMDCLCVADNRPLLIGDTSVNQPCPSFFDSKTKSMLCVPLRAGTSTLGFMHLAAAHPFAFGQQDLDLALAIGEQLAVAVQRTQLYDQINELAVTDPLTGLWNMRDFYRRVDEEFKRSERYHRPLSLLMLDVDYFKDYNDRLGHQKGDVALKKIADSLVRNTREADAVFRYGGEEICILLPETDKQQARVFAERLRQIIDESHFEGEEGQPNQSLTVSVGVASFPYDAVNKDALINDADTALYQAKAEGRNKVCAYEASK
jgi:diguanylate cyclase (GGDEF)-like protein